MTVTLLCAGGCGVPDIDEVRTVNPSQVPYNLLQQQPAPAGAVRIENTSGLGVYLTRDDQLVRLGLGPSADPRLPPVVRALDALTSGPTTAEQHRGIGTAIPPGLQLVLTRSAGGLAEIDMTGDAAHPDIEHNALVAAQIVLTVTSAPDVDRVLLTRNGQHVDAALPHGDLATRAVTATDYQLLVHPPGNGDDAPSAVPASPTGAG